MDYEKFYRDLLVTAKGKSLWKNPSSTYVRWITDIRAMCGAQPKKKKKVPRYRSVALGLEKPTFPLFILELWGQELDRFGLLSFGKMTLSFGFDQIYPRVGFLDTGQNKTMKNSPPAPAPAPAPALSSPRTELFKMEISQQMVDKFIHGINSRVRVKAGDV